MRISPCEVVREPARAPLRGARLDVEQLDVTSPVVADKVRELVLKYGPVYALVNNAGIGVGGVFEEQSDADVRDQFETNVFGLMAVTRAVLPAMRAARRGRIVNVSSLSGRIGLPCVSVYAATKHAIEGFSEALRWETEPFGIQVCVVEPGTFKTDIFGKNQRRGAGVDMEGPYGVLNRTVERLVAEELEKAPGPEVVGRAIAHLVADPSPPFRTVLGRDARTLVALRRFVPDRVFATGVRRVLVRARSR